MSSTAAGGTQGETELISAHFRERVVLVTGAFGFIGSAVVARLAAAGADIRLLRRSRPSGDEAGHVATTIYGDVTELDTWDHALPGVDTVFHLAAQTSTKLSEHDPGLDYRANVEGTRNMLDVCRRLGSRQSILFAGTETQVGVPPALPLRGDEPDRPASFYDLHKLLAEQELEFHARRGVIRATSLRLPTVYGSGTREGSPDCGMLNGMIRRALSGEPLSIYGTGERLRDFVHVDDVARAFLLAACAMDRCNARHFIVATGERCTVKDAILEVAEATKRATGRAVAVEHVDEPPDEPLISKAGFAAEPRALQEATGWQPRYRLAEGIAETVRAFRALPNGG
jgi:nucleoside-diphosphate-sugar epimerase